MTMQVNSELDISARRGVIAGFAVFTIVGLVSLIQNGLNVTWHGVFVSLSLIVLLTIMGMLLLLDYKLCTKRIKMSIRKTKKLRVQTSLEDINKVHRVEEFSGGISYPKHMVYVTHDTGWYTISTLNKNFYEAVELLRDTLPEEKIDPSIYEIRK